LTAASFTAIGAFSDVTLGFFERERKDYKRIPLDEQVEVLTLVGDIALKDGERQVHAHAVVGETDGSAWGGHLLEAHVWPTLERALSERADGSGECGLGVGVSVTQRRGQLIRDGS
jgi:predicted DNA-binding protein with PD1-like motif